MATDNVSVNPGTQPNKVSVATKEVSGVHYPVYFLSDENGAFGYVDQFSGAVGAIDQEHLQIHLGNGYTFAEKLAIDDIGGADNVHDILIKVPAATFPHLRNVSITTTATAVDVELYEDTTVSADGTEKTPRNNARNSSNTPSVTVFNSPTVTGAGTLLETILLTGTKQTGAFGSDGVNEWQLKANANSMLRITNNTPGAGTSDFVVNMFWYES